MTPQYRISKIHMSMHWVIVFCTKHMIHFVTRITTAVNEVFYTTYECNYVLEIPSQQRPGELR